MTATTVDGRVVIASEPVKSPLNRPGQPVEFKRILRLLLDDDSTVYGCVECDYTNSKTGSVRAHLRAHRLAKSPKPGAKPRAAKAAKAAGALNGLAELNIGQLIARAESVDAMAAALEKLSGERNEWKGRALKAERAMATLRKALS